MERNRQRRASSGGSGPAAGITLKGGPAIIALVVLVGFYALTFVVSRRALDDEALAPIRLQLQGEYTTALLPGVDPQNPDPEAVERLTALQRIEFASVSVRGFGSDVIVRVEPRVDGQPRRRQAHRRIRRFREHIRRVGRPRRGAVLAGH